MALPSAPARADGDLVMPDLRFMPIDKAEAALKTAGFQGTVTREDSLCGSVVDGRIVELGQVCAQFPPAGRRQGPKLPVSLRAQTEDPRHGNLGKVNEWHLMPKVVGMTLAEARAALKQAGFTDEETINEQTVSEAGCQAGRVCRSYPDGLERAGQHSGKTLFVGR